jgi:hypothetical protein
MDDSEPPRERDLRRKYRRRISLASAAYVVVLLPVTFWGGLDGQSPWRFAIALIPLLPAAWMCAVIIGRFRQLDEYQLRLAFLGIAAAFVVTMLTTATIGFLSIAGLVVPFGPWIIFAAGGATWWITNQITGAAQQF